MTVCLHKNIGYSRQQRFYDLLCPLQSVLDSSGEHGQDVERGVLLITCNIQIFQWAHWPLLSRERLRAISLCSNVVQMDGRFDCSFGGIMFLLASPFEGLGCVFHAISGAFHTRPFDHNFCEHARMLPISGALVEKNMGGWQ